VVFLVGGVLHTRTHYSDSTAGEVPTATDGAAQGGFAIRGAAGTIRSISGSTITLDAVERGTSSSTTTAEVIVKTTGSTTYSEMATGSVRDLHKGDTVLVRGTADGSTIAATDVVEGGQGGFGFGGGGAGQDGPARRFGGTPPAGVTPPTDASGQPVRPGQGRFGGGGFAAGTVASVDGDGFTLTERDGTTMTVTTTSSTTVTVSKEISRDDLAKGDTILVVGDRSGDTVTATSIRKGDAGQAGFGFGGPGGFGRGGSTTSTTAPTS
jgi:hypothetical protein